MAAAKRILDDLGDDEAMSMRAVAREVGTAATSVYLHFTDRDALVLAVLNHCHDELTQAVADAEALHADPVAALRARTLVLGRWALKHPGLYKVLHESTLNQRTEMPFKQVLAERTTAAVQRCMDAGAVPVDDAATVAIDLRAAVHGAVSMRLNQPDDSLQPLQQQIERLMTKIVGVPTVTG
jgi:AcrR family transcriptional regulator